MANVQIDKGNYTRFSNKILGVLMQIKLSGQELQLILFVFRKTFGYEGKHKGDFISLSQIAEGINVRQERASKILSAVIKRNIILVENGAKGTINFLSFNKDFDVWTTAEKDSSLDDFTTVEMDSSLNDFTTVENDIGLLSKKTLTTVEKDSKTTVENDIYKRKKETIQKKLLKKVENIPKIENNLSDMNENFIKDLEPYLVTYTREMLNEFYNYWGEKNKSKTKMRFELEKTWDLSMRLAKWKANEIKWEIKRNGTRIQQPITESKLRQFAESIANDPDLK